MTVKTPTPWTELREELQRTRDLHYERAVDLEDEGKDGATALARADELDKVVHLMTHLGAPSPEPADTPEWRVAVDSDREHRTESPAETLRRAARLMRERAEAVSQEEESRGPWQAGTVTAQWAGFKDRGAPYAAEVGCVQDATDQCLLVTLPHAYMDHAMVTYTASWHPLVAAFVADWLDAEAAALWEPPIRTYSADHALDVARVYLGEDR